MECLVERPSRSRTDYVVKARSQFKERSVATNVEIILPLPSDATAPVTRCSQVREWRLGEVTPVLGRRRNSYVRAAANLRMLCFDLCLSASFLPQGSASYAPEKSALVWHMRNFPGGKEYMLR